MPDFTIEEKERWRSYQRGSVVAVTWDQIDATNTTGDNFEGPQYADKTVQITGTWDGATVLIQGSNDATTYFTLTDPQGNAVSFTADGMETIMESPLYIRPFRSVAGGGTVDVNVVMTCRA